MDNFATFHQIYSNMCLKSSRYVSTSHKTWSGEFRNKGTAKFAKNRRFLNRVYSLLPSCSAILDFSCWPHFRYVCVSNLCLLYLWSGPIRAMFLASKMAARAFSRYCKAQWCYCASLKIAYLIMAFARCSDNIRAIQMRSWASWTMQLYVARENACDVKIRHKMSTSKNPINRDWSGIEVSFT